MEIDRDQIPAQQEIIVIAGTARPKAVLDRNQEWVMVPVHYTVPAQLDRVSVLRMLSTAVDLMTQASNEECIAAELREKLNDIAVEVANTMHALDAMAISLGMARTVHPDYPIWPGVKPVVSQ